MLKVVSDRFWPEVARLSKGSKNRYLAIAFVTKEIINLKNKDVLIVDASEECIKAGATDARLLRKFIRRGVSVYNCQGLHAKTIAGDGFAAISSANMSNSSQSKLIELGIVTDRSDVIAGARAFVRELQEQCEELSIKKIDKLCKIKVSTRVFGPRSIKLKAPKLGNQNWIVGVKYIKQDLPKDQQSVVDSAEKELGADYGSYIRWGKNTKFAKAVKSGDRIIEIYRETERSIPDSVSIVPVLMKKRGAKHVFLFLGDELTQFKEKSWKEFQTVLRLAGYRRRVTRDSCHLVLPRPMALLESYW